MKKIFVLIVSVLLFGLLISGCENINSITSPGYISSDGDLDRCPTCVKSDSATGWGDPIKSRGPWFMYNYYDGSTDQWEIHAGSTKKGLNQIGYFWVNDLGGGYYRVKYYLYPTFVAVDEHLAISDTKNFTGAPGRDDNMDFGEEFYDADGKFYIFAHFAVECAR